MFGIVKNNIYLILPKTISKKNNSFHSTQLHLQYQVQFIKTNY
jgi:hypothetical protein